MSNDITITTTRTVSEVIFEIDGKITVLARQFEDWQKQASETLQEHRSQIEGLHSELRVINERINSVNDLLASMQYTLSWGVSFVSVLLVALPLIWGVREFFSFSIKDAIREAVKAELDARKD